MTSSLAPERSQPFEAWKSWLLFAAASALALAGAELALRALGHRPLALHADRERFWKHDSLLGWHHRPGQIGVFETGEVRVDVRFNSRGLRDQEYSYERIPDTQRILVLGDSFAWGFGVEQHQAFGERIEAALDGVEVINAGVTGYSTDQELLWLETEGVKYRPDLVILLLAGNDETMNRRNVAFLTYPKPFFTLGEGDRLVRQNVPVPKAPLWRRLAFRACARSALANLLAGRSARALRALRTGGDSTDTASNDVEPYALTVALVETIGQISADSGARFMIAATGMFWPLERGDRFEDLTSILKRRGIELLDVEAAPGFEPERMRLSDGHWNAEGHAFAADRILHYIETRGLLE